MISTEDCSYNKDSGNLYLLSQRVGGHFPRSLVIKSHYTGAEITFVAINSDHPLYDEDGWDGELALYVPTGGKTNVKLLTISHGC